MRRPCYILATAGHVDHGKTTLVHALTGTDTDRLPQEKARGMTIDLGFAHLDLDPPADADGGAGCRLGVIDVPGHEDFVKNMVAGVGSIDLALLVVAADDGWMPQTEEHLQILAYLGVSRGVVAVTKVDLVADASAAVASVGERLRGTVLADAPVVGVSGVRGLGVERLRDALRRVAAAAPPPADWGRPRLSIDRVFAVRGAGTVVTGTLAGGRLGRGQEVVVQPSGVAARVRAIQTHGRDVERVGPGERVALNLPGVRAEGAGAARRGDVVTAGDAAPPADTLDVRLWRLPRRGDAAAAERPIRSRAAVWVHHGCAARRARLQLLDAEGLGAGEAALARLHLSEPLGALLGDCLVVRDAAQRRTLAGGVVLHMAARGGARPRAARHLAMLRDRAEAPRDPAVLLRSALRGGGAVAVPALVAASPASASAVRDAAERLAAGGGAVVVDGWAVSGEAWRSWLAGAARAVDEEHARRPEGAGLDVSVLRQRVEALAPPPLVGPLIEAMVGDGFVRRGAVIARAGHRPAPRPQLRAAVERLRAALAERPLTPPSRRELAPDDESHRALQFLLLKGEAVELSPSVVILAEALDDAAARVRAHLGRHGTATVSDLKAALGSTRRVVVPLLERLDRDRTTRRDGDRRRLADPPRTADAPPGR